MIRTNRLLLKMSSLLSPLRLHTLRHRTSRLHMLLQTRMHQQHRRRLTHRHLQHRMRPLLHMLRLRHTEMPLRFPHGQMRFHLRMHNTP